MRRTRFDDDWCPIARTTDLLADWWTPLLLRELFAGKRRFDDFIQSLDISRAVLTQRLKRLEAEGIVARVQYEDRPPRFEYRLTEKGKALWDVLAAMWRFGDDWLFVEDDGSNPGATVELFDTATSEPIEPRVVNQRTGTPVPVRQTSIRFKKTDL